MINVGIIGGAGYTAGELIRILLYHPNVQLNYIHSKSQAGKPVTAIHGDLIGETELVFTDQPPAGTDALFLCMGHGESVTWMREHAALAEKCAIIDLSHDFRIKASGHQFVYGLPELQRTAIQEARHIANPGCFATAIQLALLPLAHAGLLNEEVHVHAITGSTGAGQKPTHTSHFSWRNNNVSVYKAFDHQHLAEIRQSLNQLSPTGFSQPLNFIPMRGNFTRGIMATAYTTSILSTQQLTELYQQYYADAPFTCMATENPDLKQVVNTNKCILFAEQHQGKALIISMIDNLLKGASGQAVQNMNLVFGFPETAGLWLKPIAF
jgi:N-acetyl-gamma-glutamyl-phosphate reductase